MKSAFYVSIQSAPHNLTCLSVDVVHNGDLRALAVHVHDGPDALGNISYRRPLVLAIHVEMQRPIGRANHADAIALAQLVQVGAVFLDRGVAVFQYGGTYF